MYKVNNKDTSIFNINSGHTFSSVSICTKLTIKTLVSSTLTLDTLFFSVSIVDFEQVHTS